MRYYHKRMNINREDIMTPSDINVLLHYHVCPEPHPRLDAPAIQETIAEFVTAGILKPGVHPSKDGSYITTGRGNALVQMLCSTPFPVQKWVDQNNKIIEI